MPDGIRLGGAYYELTADDSALIRALARSQAQAKSFSDAIGRSMGQASSSVEQANRRMAQSTQQSQAQMLGLVKSMGGFAAAAAGVVTGAAAINQAMTAIAESTQRAAQAQFALNQLYGAAAPLITQQAEAQARMAGRSRNEAREASAAVASLARNYALTGAQIQQVLKISADLAAVRGIGMEQASERVASALRGEAEAIEYLGQSLQSGALKSLGEMTAEQREHFETLNDVTKAQIILNTLIRDTADLQGAAAKRTQDAAGAMSNLNAATENLAESIGKRFAPATVRATNVLSDFVTKADEFVRSDFVDRLGQAANIMAAMATLDPNAIAQALVRAQGTAGVQVGPDAGLPGSGAGPTGAQTQAIRDADALRRQAQAADRDALRQFVEERKRAVVQVAEIEERRLRKEADLRDKAIDQEIIRLQVRQAAELDALEVRERNTIRALEAEGRAKDKAFEADIERLELEKDARIAAADAAADAATRAIDDEEERLDQLREAEDRARDDERQQEDRDIEDARRVEDRVRDAAQKREIRRLEDLRDARIDAIETDIEAHNLATEKKLRNIDREADRARAASEKALARLERQGEREDEQHRKRMRALDDEQDASLGILDAQLKALDAADKAADAAERIADIQKRITDAQRAVTAARGTGTPEQIAEARGELTNALRVGNEVSIANARERLVQLAGQGNEAIQQADEELAEAQSDLAKQGVDQAQDAERDKLKAAQDAIRAEIEGRKRAEEDENRQRKQSLEREQEAERTKLKGRLDRLEKQQRATQDAAKEELRLLRDGLDEERSAAEENIQIARDRFEAEGEILNDRRREEDRFRDDQRVAQDRLRKDEREAQDKALKDQLEAIRATLELERKEAEAHYTGPNGLITQAKKAQEDYKEAHRLRLDDTKIKFQEERDAIKAVYTNEGKTGLIDLQNQAAENNRARLAEQTAALETWKNDANRFIEDNKGKWNSLAEAIEAVSKAIKNLPRSGGSSPIVVPSPGSIHTGVGDSPGGGSGSPASPPSVSGSSPIPITEEPMSGGVDVSGSRFETSFGYGVPYGGSFAPGPGWSGGAAWAGGPSHHKGVDLVIKGAKNGGKGQPIGAFVGGTIVSSFTNYDPSKSNSTQAGGRYVVVQSGGKTFWYMHLDSVAKSSGSVQRGDVIGTLGDSGIENPSKSHLHFEVRNGLNNGPQSLQELKTNGIDPTTYLRDSGYLFREPTLTYGLRTGERNMIAERRPEMLLGGRETAAMRRPGSLLGPGPMSDYGALGAALASVHPGGSSSRVVNEGDVIFNGLTYEQAETRQRRQQRRRSLLKGVGRVR